MVESPAIWVRKGPKRPEQAPDAVRSRENSMRAVTWHGRADVRGDTVPDPVIQQPTDVIVEVTSTGICGSGLPLMGRMASFMTVGNVMGREPMGIVREVGADVTAVKPGRW